MMRQVLLVSAVACLVAFACGGDDKKKTPLPATGGSAGSGGRDAGMDAATEAGAAGEPASAGGMGGTPAEGGASGEAGAAGAPEPTIVDVSTNRGGGRVQAGYHTCVALASGAVYCAGDNTYSQLGNASANGEGGSSGAGGDIAINATPVQVNGPGGVGSLTNAERVACGEGFSCAKLQDGSAWCWGDNLFAQLGDGTQNNEAASPVQVLEADLSGAAGAGGQDGQGGQGSMPLRGVAAIASGTLHSCALGSDQDVRCWGQNVRGQVGPADSNTYVLTATKVGLTAVAQVGAGYQHTCARRTGAAPADRGVYCWGHGERLGQGADITDRATPIQVLDDAGTGFLNDIVSLAVGGTHACAAKSDGSVWCWGANDRGQCGTGGVEVIVPLPVQVILADDTALSGVASVYAGDVSTCAITATNDVWCWGGNESGQLGIDSLMDQPNPVQIPAFKAQKIAMGEGHACAIDVAGRAVLCWGDNSNGQLGTTNTDDSLVPVAMQIPGL